MAVAVEGAPGTRHRDAGKAPVQPPPDRTVPLTDQEPDVDRAAHMYRTATSATTDVRGGLETEQQARSLLHELKARMAQDPAQALSACGRANPQQGAALLARAPA
jgi:hypothetical protein